LKTNNKIAHLKISTSGSRIDCSFPGAERVYELFATDRSNNCILEMPLSTDSVLLV